MPMSLGEKTMPPAHPFDDDKLKEECGVYGVVGLTDAANFVALGLHALQHRGQEAGGIVSYHPDHGFNSARRFGYVRDNFTKASLMETLTISSSIFIIAVGASMLTRFFTFSGVSDALADGVLEMGVSPLMLIFAITLLYLVLGMFLEPIGAMLLTLPILLPLVETAGIELLWFGVLVAKLLEIGMITPPIGLNVFVLKGVMAERVSTGTIFRGVAYFIMADLAIICLMVAFPDMILFTQNMLP